MRALVTAFVGILAITASAPADSVPANARPKILSVSYGLFQPRGASKPYLALRVRTRDRDGQVVALEWTQVSPPPDRPGVAVADGGCGLAARRNGAVGTWYLPMTLPPGSYRFRFKLSSSSCAGRGRPQTVRQTVGFNAGAG